MSPEFELLVADLNAFCEARGWGSSSTLKNSSISLSIKANALREHSKHLNENDLNAVDKDPHLEKIVEHLSSDIADVFIFLVLVSEKLGVDPLLAARDKLQQNESRYPAVQSNRRELLRKSIPNSN